MIPYLFRVHRTKVDGQTVELRLEPFAADAVLHPNEGDQFITGFLAVDPFPEPETRAGS